MRMKKSLLNLLFWVGLAILFNIYIFYTRGDRAGVEFFGGYIIEMSLSLDNLFLFLMIFTNFGIDEEYQERVLLFGVIGAVVLRLICILLGGAIINKFQWILYLFGILLLLSGFKMLFSNHESINFHDTFAVKGLMKIMPVTSNLYGHKFFVKKNKILYATPLFAILLIIELSDVIFALDSIPAIFSITRDTFIAYTSNIFAILGLRSMYYILVRMNNKFRFMRYGVAFVLMFTGIKLGVLYFGVEISASVSVLIIMIILLCSILISLIYDDICEKRGKLKFLK